MYKILYECVLPINFKYCFKSLDKVHNYLTRLEKKLYQVVIDIYINL